MTEAVRFYSAEQVHAALDYSALADAIAEAMSGGVNAPLRHAHALSASDSLLLMPAWTDGSTGTIGVKLVTVLPGNRQHGRATVNALYVAFDRATGEPRAVIDGEALTVRRTAAASLLAARYLARSDARRLLVVGSGRLAYYLAHAHCAGRNIERVLVWGRNRDRAELLAAKLRAEGVAVDAATDLEAAMRSVDIVSCATTATEPIVRGAWLQPGVHLDLVGAFKRGMREADDAAVARARIVVDTRAGALAEADDIIEPIERGAIQREAIVAELADLVNDRVSGRLDDRQVTLFKSVGAAVEDLAAAQLVLRSAG